jgi:toxin ParE1/3/4
VSVLYILTNEAENDLREIIRYTRRKHGEKQVRTYVAGLRHCAEALVKGEGNLRNLPEIHDRMRMVRCQHHYLFCIMRDTQPPMIVAILHERMDMLQRLGNRLQ